MGAEQGLWAAWEVHNAKVDGWMRGRRPGLRASIFDWTGLDGKPSENRQRAPLPRPIRCLRAAK